MSYKQLASLFSFIQEDDVVTNLDVSSVALRQMLEVPTKFNVESIKIADILQNMLKANKTLRVLNLAGLVDENIGTVLTRVLPECTLTTLKINFNRKICTFDLLERLLCAFMQSNVCCLHIEDICGIHLKRHESGSYHVAFSAGMCNSNVAKEFSEYQFLQSFTVLFILYVVGRQAAEITLSMNGKGFYFLTKAFQLVFSSAHDSIANDLLEHTQKWHLELSAVSKELFCPVIAALCSSSSLQEMHLHHDATSVRDENLAKSYEKLIVANESIQVISFDGIFNDQLASAVIAGLSHSNTLQAIRFSVSHLTNQKLVKLLCSVYESGITCMRISEGCNMKRKNQHAPFEAELVGDKALFCKMYCASARVSKKHPDFLRDDPVLSGKVLNLTAKHNEICVGTIDFSNVYETAMDGLVSSLKLSKNYDIDLDDRLLSCSTSVLESLYLDRCGVTDVNCKHIAHGLATNKHLKILDLSNNPITYRGAELLLQSLTKNDTLQVLDISRQASTDNHITSVCHRAISFDQNKNTTLLNLSLGYCDRMYFEILTATCDLTTLKELYVEVVEEELLIELLDSLHGCSALEELDISKSAAKTVSVVVAIQRLLEQDCCHLKALNMSFCEISDEAGVILAEALHNKHIERLNLSGNEICGRGLLALFKVVESNSCPLTELNISSIWSDSDFVNFSRDETEGATILQFNSSLKTLILSDFPSDEFNDWFGVKLFRGLMENSTLSTLNISGTVLSVDVFRAFVDMLSSNSTLTNLDIFHTQFFWCDYNLAEALLKCLSLEKLTVDQVTEELLHRQSEELCQNVSVIRKTDRFRNTY